MSPEQISQTIVMNTEQSSIALSDSPAQSPNVVSEERTAQQSVDAQPPIDRSTLLPLICAGYSFFCAGVNDDSLGPLIPYLIRSYSIGTNFVSIVYERRQYIPTRYC